MQLPPLGDFFKSDKPSGTGTGGARRKRSKASKKSAKTVKKADKPKKTSQKVVGSDGKPHTVYKKDGVSYIRKKSSKTGKYYYSRVTKA